MGSFNLACAISGLPVTPGDDVYVMLVTRNHEYGWTDDVYTNAYWVPRSPAMLGKYDDYGRVTLSDSEGERAIQRLTEAMLDLEAVERGSSRGAHVKHGMGLPAYLEAIQEGNVSVLCASWQALREANRSFDLRYETKKPPPPVIGPIPTVSSVVAVLDSGGYKANSPSANSYIVDAYGDGEVVVRCPSFGALRLEDASRLLSANRYVCALSRGRGVTEDKVLRVFAQPGPWVEVAESSSKSWTQDPDDKAMLVGRAVIRADVWRRLLDMPVPSWRRAEGTALDRYVNDESALRRTWAEALRLNIGLDEAEETCRRISARSEADRTLWGDGDPSPLAGHLGLRAGGGSGSPQISGWSEHYEAWVLANLAEGDAPKAAPAVGQRFAECCMVYDHLQSRSMRLMPSQYAGQDERWIAFEVFHRMVASLAASEERKYQAEEAAWRLQASDVTALQEPGEKFKKKAKAKKRKKASSGKRA